MPLEPSVPIRANVYEGKGQLSVATWATGERDGEQFQERAVFTPAASNPAVRW